MPDGVPTLMRSPHEPAAIPDDRLSLEQRSDGAVVVRVRSADTGAERLPDAVFSFRCGDPQYAYWLQRLGNQAANRASADQPH